MASIHQTTKSPFWYCAYTLPDGRRVYRSTGQKDIEKAKIIRESLQRIEKERTKGTLSQERVTELLTDVLISTGVKPESAEPIPTILGRVCIPESGFFVYAIQSGSFIKIGKTMRLRKRVATYRAHNPTYKLLSVRSFSDAEAMAAFEKCMHTKFTNYRKDDEQEWFKNTPEIRTAFAKAMPGQLIYLNYFAL